MCTLNSRPWRRGHGHHLGYFEVEVLLLLLLGGVRHSAGHSVPIWQCTLLHTAAGDAASQHHAAGTFDIYVTCLWYIPNACGMFLSFSTAFPTRLSGWCMLLHRVEKLKLAKHQEDGGMYKNVCKGCRVWHAYICTYTSNLRMLLVGLSVL